MRQAQLWPLRRMQRHHHTTQHLPDEQPDQGPEHVAAQHHRQRARDDGGDLKVGAHPQRELAVELAVPFGRRNVVDGTPLDKRRGPCLACLHHRVASWMAWGRSLPVVAPRGLAELDWVRP
ncbi:hypothetical protein D3C87_1734800 [compost metagenome]